jgi:hypothetical protein
MTARRTRKAIAKVDAREASARDALFEEWFVAQYGRSPLTDRLAYADRPNTAQQVCMECGAKILDQQEDWDERHDAALKAWTAARTQKP